MYNQSTIKVLVGVVIIDNVIIYRVICPFAAFEA